MTSDSEQSFFFLMGKPKNESSVNLSGDISDTERHCACRAEQFVQETGSHRTKSLKIYTNIIYINPKAIKAEIYLRLIKTVLAS
jgi:hypothetical protein